jgi:hypothetical protein
MTALGPFVCFLYFPQMPFAFSPCYGILYTHAHQSTVLVLYSTFQRNKTVFDCFYSMARSRAIRVEASCR